MEISRRHVVAIFVLASIVAAVPAARASSSSTSNAAGGLRKLSQPRLNDLSVVQFPGSPSLTPFTVNHHFRSTFLVRGHDRTASVGLSPSPAYPGYEQLRHGPRMRKAGLYVFARDEPGNPHGGHLVLATRATAARGSIRFHSRVHVLSRRKASAGTRTAHGWTTLRFAIRRGGMLKVNSNLSAPAEYGVETPKPGGRPAHAVAVPPGSLRIESADVPVFVGARAVPFDPAYPRLVLHDRHGYASGDFDNDGKLDLFISSGGLGGGIAKPRHKGAVQDELLLFRRGQYVHRDDLLNKGACRGRETAAPDVNGDGRADIFEACQGRAPVVWLQGRWKRIKLPGKHGSYHWANVDRDPEPELLAFRGDRMQVWSRGRRRQYAVDLRGPIEGAVSISNLEGDGRATIFVPSSAGSSVVKGRDVRSPEKLGLPASSNAVSVVDVDNDGRDDVQLAPQGLFIKRDGGFERTGKLQSSSERNLLSWPDLNEDGRRDALMAGGDSGRRMTVRVRRNHRRAGRWLQVDVPDVLGARITVRTRQGKQVGWTGESEGGRWSDTHRRVYFGVGKARVARVKVRMPRGTRRTKTKTNRVVSFAGSG